MPKWSQINLLFQIAALAVLLVSCGNKNEFALEELPETLVFETDTLMYKFTSRVVHGIGTPFDFCYFYDESTNLEYVYQIEMGLKKEAHVIKYLLGDQPQPITVLDTFHLDAFCVEPTISSLYLSVTAEDSLILIKNSHAEMDSIYTFYQDQFLSKQKFLTENGNHHFVTDYNIRFNKIVSSNFVADVYPIYTRNTRKKSSWSYRNT